MNQSERTLAGARLKLASDLRDRLWKEIVAGMRPTLKDMVYECNGLDLLINSIGDTLQPGYCRLQISEEVQLDAMLKAVTKAYDLLAAADTRKRRRVSKSRIGKRDTEGG